MNTLTEKQKAFRLRQQILACRDDGRFNMLLANQVQWLANEKNFYELVIFIEEDRKAYSNFIFTGDLPNLTDEEAAKMVRTVLDGEEIIWDDRKEAEEHFKNMASKSEGCACIYRQILDGKENCTDTKDEDEEDW